MYTNLGYIVFRTILDYYSGDQDEDAYGICCIYLYSRHSQIRNIFSAPFYVAKSSNFTNCVEKIEFP